jgi:uncharacterized membrane protein YjdF
VLKAPCPASATERIAVQIVGVALVGFAILGFATGSSNTVTYVTSIVAIGFAIRGLRRTPLPDALALALALHAVFHLAGGLVNVGNDVLYNASIGPMVSALHTHVLQYDHLVHAFGSCVGTLTLWTLLAPEPTSRASGRNLAILCVLAGLGIGALNEMIEFLATIAHSGAHVGGYDNTGWDLVCNTIGGLVAAGVIERVRRKRLVVAALPTPA